MFVYEGFPDPVGREVGELILGAFFGLSNARSVSKQYPWPKQPHADVRDTLTAVATDALFACATRNATLGLNSHSHPSAVFLYEFDHPWSFGKHGWGPHFEFCDNVTCHGGELPFVFCPNAKELNITITADELRLCAAFQQYWAAFARVIIAFGSAHTCTYPYSYTHKHK